MSLTKFVAACVLLFSPCLLLAQQGVIGKITDEKNKPLRKVEVSVKGTPIVSYSNSDGVYIIKAVTEDTLLFVHKNFRPEEVVVDRTTINIRLEEDKQLQKVQGKITDEQGEPVIGINVFVKKGGRGTVTDLQGEYEIYVPKGEVLVFSGVEWREEMIIKNSERIDFRWMQETLEIDTLQLAYAKQLERTLTSAVTSIRSHQFNSGNINDPLQLIQGKVAGLTITKPGGDPAGDFAVRIRGLSTLTARTEPLLVVDGVPQALLLSVDPNDVASITVLKDASTSAMYGIRSASGVLLITTKKGQEGENSINYNTYLAIENVARRPDVLTAAEFRQFNVNGFQGQDFGASTDWGDEITRTAVSQVHNLSLSGGNAKTTYRAALNYREIQGTLRFHEFNRLNARFQVQQKALKDHLTLTANLIGTTYNERSPISSLSFNTNDVFNYAVLYNPTAPIRSDAPEFKQYDGYFQQVQFNYFNPVALIEQNYSEAESNYLQTNLRAEFKLTEGLTAAAFYAKESWNTLSGAYYDKNSLYAGFDRGGLASREQTGWINELAEVTAQYEQQFEKGRLNVFAGHSYQTLTEEGFFAQGGDFLTDAFLFHNLAAALDFYQGVGESGFPRARVESFKTKTKLSAFFGRAMVDWKDAYFLTASLRREGASNLGQNNRWGWFPAVSAGVETSSWVGANFFQSLKFRAGYGISGNIPRENGLSKAQLQTAGQYLLNGTFRPHYLLTSFENSDLSYEKLQEWNVGVDFQLSHTRIGGSLNWYNRRTTNVLWPYFIDTPLSGTIGTTGSDKWINVGELSNQGLELAIQAEVIKQPDFQWNININLFANNTKIGFLSNEEVDFVSPKLYGGRSQGGIYARLAEGENFGNLMSPVFVGIENGRWVFEPASGNFSELQITGNAFPDAMLGWYNQLTLGRWQLDFLMRGAFGHDIFNIIRAFQEAPAIIAQTNILQSTTEGEVRNLTDFPRGSDYHIEDGSFFRMDNITLCYVPAVSNVQWLNNLQLYLTVQNLFTLTNFSGIDPEVRIEDSGFGTPNPLIFGQEHRNTYWLGRTFLLGIQIGMN